MTKTRQTTAREIRAMLDTIKTQAGCTYCGFNAHPSALDFDHLDQATKYRTRNGRAVTVAEMAKGARYSLRTILAEIAKCRILCANCHRIHTHTVQRGRG